MAYTTLRQCGVSEYALRRIALYLRHPAAECMRRGGAAALHRRGGGWCSICGERCEHPFFCMSTYHPLCEECLIGERCCFCY